MDKINAILLPKLELFLITMWLKCPKSLDIIDTYLKNIVINFNNYDILC